MGRHPVPENEKRKRRLLWMTDSEWGLLVRLLPEVADRYKDGRPTQPVTALGRAADHYVDVDLPIAEDGADW